MITFANNKYKNLFNFELRDEHQELTDENVKATFVYLGCLIYNGLTTGDSTLDKFIMILGAEYELKGIKGKDTMLKLYNKHVDHDDFSEDELIEITSDEPKILIGSFMRLNKAF